MTLCIISKSVRSVYIDTIMQAQLQSKAEMRVGFVQALVRRIRRLLKLRAAAF